ncbi:hypothetical protein [Allopontixanthobacter sediminis]|uniref:Uncharacterized protein n=1 Tax=Allopontixanthobacter sediminis TaxID=1689985 RepID=A0A845B298_9SPHN|nr:hypothetical protein [Allopontixanthobacter sediminis]MXP45381.1 hypothetical protein [Allopontixanthobacter sediminis]
MYQLLQTLHADLHEGLRETIEGLAKTGGLVSLDRADLWELLDQIPVAIMMSNDPGCEEILGNLAANALLRIPRGGNLSQSAPSQDVPGFRVYQASRLIPPEELPMQLAAATGLTVTRSECRIRFDDGHTIFLAGHTIPLR